MDRQPRDLRGLRIWASDGQEAAHLAVDLRDEPRLGSHCFRALPDALLQPEPVGQRRDDRITGGAVARVEWSDHGRTIPPRPRLGAQRGRVRPPLHPPTHPVALRGDGRGTKRPPRSNFVITVAAPNRCPDRAARASAWAGMRDSCPIRMDCCPSRAHKSERGHSTSHTGHCHSCRP